MPGTSDRSAVRSRSPRTKSVTPRVRDPEPIIEVRRSSIQGRGVFALKAIRKGAKILEYTGERISHDEASARYDDEKVRRHHTFLFAVDDEICIDGARGGNDARYINHSCDPNAYAIVEKRRVFIRALRSIAKGEEIVYDYWYTTDDSYTLEDRRRLYPCKCGAPKCRGTLAAPPKKPRAKKPKADVAQPAQDQAAAAQ